MVKASDLYLFELEPVDILMSSVDFKREWIQSVHGAIKLAEHERSNEQREMQRSMEKWTSDRIRRIR